MISIGYDKMRLSKFSPVMISKAHILHTLDTLESEILDLAKTNPEIDDSIRTHYLVFCKRGERFVDEIRNYVSTMPQKSFRFERRRKRPLQMNFQEYLPLFEAVHDYEGCLTVRQLTQLFFKDEKLGEITRVLQILFDNEYINLHDATVINGRMLGEVAVTLAKKGAIELARNSNTIMSLKPFRIKDDPNWLRFYHDMCLNDFRIILNEAVIGDRSVSIPQWLSEKSLFRSSPKIPGRPDGFFLLRRPSMTHPDHLDELAFLPELDNADKKASHTMGDFVKKKVKPALAYIGSQEYLMKFGVQDGAYLVVTTGGKRRMRNLKRATEEAGGEGLFYFTTMNEISADTVLDKPIWHLAGSEQRFSIKNLPLDSADAGILHNATDSRPPLQTGLFLQ